MSAQAVSQTRLYGRMLTFARIAWFVMLALGLILYVLSIPPQFFQWEMLCTEQQLGSCPNLQLTPQQAQELQQLGWSLTAYATYFTVLGIVGTLVALSLAALIFWRKSDDAMALFTSLTLVTFSTGGGLEVVRSAYPVLAVLAFLFQTVGQGSLVLFVFLFPSGRFVPRWTRWLALLVIAREVLAVFARNDFIDALFFVVTPFGLLLQAYRYRRVYNLIERQQTKWVVFGFALGIAGYSGVLLSYIVYVSQGNQLSALGLILAGTALELFLLMLPLSIGMAILRSHLWDIDVVIRRTLIYSILTASLAFVYFGSVVLLQQLFRALTGQQQSEIVTVISTLVIAALFIPLRARVQSFIDRRFFRRKYDAAQVLEQFAATARDEVELDKLTERLLDVVDETMQPTHVRVWLKASDSRSTHTRLKQ